MTRKQGHCHGGGTHARCIPFRHVTHVTAALVPHGTFDGILAKGDHEARLRSDGQSSEVVQARGTPIVACLPRCRTRSGDATGLEVVL